MAWSGFERAVRHVPGGAPAVFRAIGVPLSVIDRPGLKTPFRKYLAYFETAARLSNDPLFGLRFGAGTRAERSGIPGYLVLNARRFRDALSDLALTLPTLVGGVRIELVTERDPPALIWSLANGVGDTTQFIRHANAYFVRMLQAHHGRHWRPGRVLYAVTAPARPDRYRAVLGYRNRQHVPPPKRIQEPANYAPPATGIPHESAARGVGMSPRSGACVAEKVATSRPRRQGAASSAQGSFRSAPASSRDGPSLR